MRIATLVPSATDLVVELGLAHALVGVSHECDHPAVAHLPEVTSSSIPAAGSVDGADPAEVDDAVTRVLAEGYALYVTDQALLAELAPDLVVGQNICDVCAVAGPVARAALPDGAELVTLAAMSTSGLCDDIRRLAAAADVDDAGERLVRRVDGGLAAVQAMVTGQPRPRVLALEWLDPAFLGGHWVPELVELAGGEHLLSRPGEASRRAGWDEVAAADPDVLVALPCGYSLEAARREVPALLARPELASLRCVQAGDVWVTDASRLFSRCTANVVQAAKVLAGILHPDVCEPPAPSLAERASLPVVAER